MKAIEDKIQVWLQKCLEESNFKSNNNTGDPSLKSLWILDIFFHDLNCLLTCVYLMINNHFKLKLCVLQSHAETWLASKKISHVGCTELLSQFNIWFSSSVSISIFFWHLINYFRLHVDLTFNSVGVSHFMILNRITKCQ